MGSCVNLQKNDIANEIVEILWIFFLVILNKLIVKCVIGFDRFVNFFKDQWKCHKRGHYFQCSTKKKLCVG